jgi:hypothetical protein
VTILAVVMLLVGCGQAAPSVEKQQKRVAPERIEKAPPRDPSPDLPSYDITLERDCAESGVVGKCYGVSTDATSREELEVVTADLWLDSPGYLAVVVTFYPNKPSADASAAGFAFENEQAARVVLAQFLAQGTSVEDEVREAMGDGGIYVVAPADEARELTTQQTDVGRAGEAPAGRLSRYDLVASRSVAGRAEGERSANRVCRPPAPSDAQGYPRARGQMGRGRPRHRGRTHRQRDRLERRPIL